MGWMLDEANLFGSMHNLARVCPCFLIAFPVFDMFMGTYSVLSGGSLGDLDQHWPASG
jgi:hypothetical protein